MFSFVICICIYWYNGWYGILILIRLKYCYGCLSLFDDDICIWCVLYFIWFFIILNWWKICFLLWYLLVLFFIFYVYYIFSMEIVFKYGFICIYMDMIFIIWIKKCNNIMNVRISKNVYIVWIYCNIYYDLMKYLVYRFVSYVEKILVNGCLM